MMKRKDALKEMLAPVTGRPSEDLAAAPRAPVKPGSLKAMGLSLQSLGDEAAEAAQLRARIESGEVVVEIAPQLVAPSFVADRLADVSAGPGLDALQASIAENGQQVPILVRPFEGGDAHYQVAYGHRRLEACRRLGRPVKAIVRRLSDSELVTAQGKENLERSDLSFIERALFAARLEDKGFERAVLMAALGVHKGNLSTMIAVARAAPEALILAIGPAPKIGRPRWEALADLLKDDRSGRWRAATEAPGFSALSSDARFARVLSALAPRPQAAQKRVLKDARGKPFAECEQAGDRLRLTISDGGAFGAYLLEQLPVLHAAFERRDAE